MEKSKDKELITEMAEELVHTGMHLEDLPDFLKDKESQLVDPTNFGEENEEGKWIPKEGIPTDIVKAIEEVATVTVTELARIEEPPPLPVPDFLRNARDSWIGTDIKYDRLIYLKDALTFMEFHTLKPEPVGGSSNIFIELAVCTKTLAFLTTRIDDMKRENNTDHERLRKLCVCLAAEEAAFDDLVVKYRGRREP